MAMVAKFSFNVAEHYEATLGRITGGWSDPQHDKGVQVVRFDSCPDEGIFTLGTLGLSDTVLKSKGENNIRQEILISANDETDPIRLASVLMSVAESTLNSGRALLRGQVIGPGEKIVSQSEMDYLFVTNPSPLPEQLIVDTSLSLIFAYLIPIYWHEAERVKQLGWSDFEDELEGQNPDIWDLSRPGMQF